MKHTNIKVIVEFETDGRMNPLFIVWDDKRYAIDRVTSVRRRAATKAGGMGLCYTCFILGRERQLFYDETKWFVEEKG